MLVSDILRTKGSEVATIGPTASVEEAAARLVELGIGALVVTDEDSAVVGIVSERDLVRTIGTRGAAALAVPVSSVMTTEVVTCRRADTVDELMAVMTNGRFRHLPVVEDGRLAGIVSIGDVVKKRVGELERETEQLAEYISTGR